MTDSLKPVLLRSPTQATQPEHLRPYGLLGGRYDYLDPGYHDYISDFERENSRNDYKPFGYDINHIGFRGAYPGTDGTRTLGFFGCSMTFGEGLATDENFPDMICKHYAHDCLNLGLPGASARRVALIFAAAVRVWRMRLAVVTLPSWSRTLYMDEHGYLKNLHLSYKSQDALRENYLRFVNNQHLLYESREAIETIMVNAQLYQVPVVITSWETMTSDMIRALTRTNPPSYQLWDLTAPRDPDDYARDNAHPGINLTRRQAGKLIEYIDNNNLLPQV